MKPKLTYIIIITLLFLAIPNYCYATESGLKIYPPLIQIKMFHGTSVEAPVTIHNTGVSPVNLQILLKPFTASQKNNGQVHFITGKDLTDFQKFQTEHISVMDGQNKISSFILSPDQQKSLLLKVDLPQNTQPKDYYFSILFISNIIQSDQLNATFINQGVGTNIFLTIDPKENHTVSIEQFSAANFISKPELFFNITLHNNGNNYFIPHASVIISNLFGKEIKKISLSPGILLSNTSKNIYNQSNSNYNTYLYRDNLLPGVYKAALRIDGAKTEGNQQKIIYFTFLPVSISLEILAVIFTVILITIKILKRNKNI